MGVLVGAVVMLPEGAMVGVVEGRGVGSNDGIAVYRYRYREEMCGMGIMRQ